MHLGLRLRRGSTAPWTVLLERVLTSGPAAFAGAAARGARARPPCDFFDGGLYGSVAPLQVLLRAVEGGAVGLRLRREGLDRHVEALALDVDMCQSCPDRGLKRLLDQGLERRGDASLKRGPELRLDERGDAGLQLHEALLQVHGDHRVVEVLDLAVEVQLCLACPGHERGHLLPHVLGERLQPHVARGDPLVVADQRRFREAELAVILQDDLARVLLARLEDADGALGVIQQEIVLPRQLLDKGRERRHLAFHLRHRTMKALVVEALGYDHGRRQLPHAGALLCRRPSIWGLRGGRRGPAHTSLIGHGVNALMKDQLKEGSRDQTPRLRYQEKIEDTHACRVTLLFLATKCTCTQAHK